ncbi:neural Wiskott-Aldrich syndrome protein [Anarrhichthys ocellatus]|uniref:neural Wiskott-Aldrich syndrome protein n=1 Tax=Anarrhichthys ocellatus TaxID=433405 RepID=UPI0012ECE1C4|nr:neural Wiskott-Aldrich syndrome protein-like [Anarrhichthys ocellatus]
MRTRLIKTTVAQILVAEDTQGRSPGWSCLGCGAVCLIEDKSIHSHFLRLYCVKRATLLWEQELYIPFKYTATRAFFHTFPADSHQVGLNFAEETEAEAFHLAVEAVQRNQEMMITMRGITNSENENKSTSDPPDSGMKPLHHLDKEQHFPFSPSTTVTPTTSSMSKVPDAAMRRLLIHSRFNENDLRDEDIAEAGDFILNQFDRPKAVQKEQRNRGPVSQTLPRAAGASISLALKKGPLPPVPPIKGSNTSQHTPQYTDPQHQSPSPFQIPPPPSMPAPVLPERIRRSGSFQPVDSRKR